MKQKKTNPSSSQRLLLALKEARAQLEAAKRKEPIAIIGIGCRLPGANGAQAFWALLRDGVDAITEVPAERWDVSQFYESQPTRAPQTRSGAPHEPLALSSGKMSSRWGGFLSQIDHFDARFFGISPREAKGMDPQQRLLLEVAWEALEDGGLVPARLAKTRTGVFIGIYSSEYGMLQLRDPNITEPSHAINSYWSTGNALSIAANRLSYFFDFQGPSVALDTACSSSLVAIHQACYSLWSGQSTLALAGGVNVILTPTVTINLSQGGGISPDGRCKAFDAQANGLVRSEGVGIVVLKPLSRALADGDPIYALIRGSAVNQDGRSNGITAPNQAAQEAVLRDAYRMAEVSPSDVQYVEAHGTGTILGDPIEAKALGRVLNTPQRTYPCLIGSVKSNIGHTETAAGVTGLIKVALALKHGAIPPSLHFNTPNPHIPFDELALRVPQTLERWPPQTRSGTLSGTRYAGVSAFGMGGTNAHVVLQDAPDSSKQEPHYESASTSIHQAPLLPLSAHSKNALQQLAHAYKRLLDDDTISFTDLCYSASVRRSHHKHRLAIVFRSPEELRERLDAFLADQARAGMFTGQGMANQRPKVVFVFSGNRAQAWRYGRDLLEKEPVFRATLTACDRLFRHYAPWSLLEELTEGARLHSDHLEISQCAMFAIQVSLAALWNAWGIQPDAVVGHSLGEVAAAYMAGALTLSEAARVVFYRSHFLQEASQHLAGEGAMAAVEMPLVKAQAALAGYEERLWIIANNSPTSVVLSGEAQALHEVVTSLAEEGIFCRIFEKGGAAHTQMLAPWQSKLIRKLLDIEPKAAHLPIYSTVTAQLSDGREFDAAYWGAHLTQPVLFADAINQLAADGYDTFLELGPYPPILSPAISQCLRYREARLDSAAQRGAWRKKSLVLPALRRKADEYTHLMGTLGGLYASGYPVEWQSLYPDGGRSLPLPAYPWQHERFWMDTPKRPSQTPSPIKPQPARLLGQKLNLASPEGKHYWSITIEIESQRFPYLDDHRVQGVALLPTTAYLEMALAGAQEAFPQAASDLSSHLGTHLSTHLIEKVTIDKALFLSAEHSHTLQLIISEQGSGNASFQFFSRPSHRQWGRAEQSSWTLHASGQIRTTQKALPTRHANPLTLVATFPRTISQAEHYTRLRAQGIEYGPTFQGVQQIWWHPERGEALGQLHFPAEIAHEAAAYQVHPAFSDACGQVLIATLYGIEGMERDAGNDDLYLPTGVESSILYQRPLPEQSLWSHAFLRSNAAKERDTIKGDIFLLDEDGQVMVEIIGLTLQRVGAAKSSPQQLDRWLYDVQWQLKPRQQEQPSWATPGSWLIFADANGIGQHLAQQLRASGERTILLSLGEHYQRLSEQHYQLNPTDKSAFQHLLQDTLSAEQPPCRGIIHLWSLHAAQPAETTLASLHHAQVLGAVSVLHLVQALNKQHIAPTLCLVTSESQVVDSPTSIGRVSIAQAPLWGLGRVLFFEHPELRCKMVDLSSAQGVAAEMRALWQEIGCLESKDDGKGDGEYHVALRGERRYVARLRRLPTRQVRADTKVLRSDGTYLIVGGLRGIGLAVAQWMVQQGVRHLVLMARSAPSSEAQETIRAMEATKAKIVVARGDVSQKEQVTEVLAKINMSMPPLRGIIHSATIVDADLLQQLDQERLHAVMAPKMKGAWILHTLTLDAPLDFFVLFSSVASLLGTPGQGNYVAANAFLDAFAHYRRQQGLPALSINWGGWAEVGAAARAQASDLFALRGFKSITPEQGFYALDTLLQYSMLKQAPVSQVAVMPVNWSQVYRMYPIIEQSALFSELIIQETEIQKEANRPEKEGLTHNALLMAAPTERHSLLQAYLCEQLATTLGIARSEIDIYQPLNMMGIDSLMALEMKNRMELEIGLAIPIVKFLEGPNITELTTLLLAQLSDSETEPANLLEASKPPYEDEQNPADLLAQLDQLADEDVESLLLAMLSEEEGEE